MMKKRAYLMLIVLLCLGCSPDAMVDCLTRSGNTETRMVEVDSFDKITIRRNIELRITHAEMLSLRIEADEHLIDNIDLRVTEGLLEIEAKDLCPAGSASPPYIVHLATPNLKEIRNSSQFKVLSTNTLAFDTLRLVSESYIDELALAVGDFELNVDLTQLNIVHGGLSDFKLSGNTDRFSIGFYSGSGRIFAEDLMAKQIGIYHRGFADVHVYPIESVSGELRSTGNVILHHVPPIQNLESFFEGEVIVHTE